MKKKIFISIALLLVLIPGIAMFAKHLIAPMPVYEGRTASEWLDDINTSRNEAAMEAFRAMGTNAFPTLIRALKKKEPVQTRINRKIYPHLPGLMRRFWLAPTPSQRALQTWAEAYWVLANVTNANQTLPDLVQIWRNKTYGSRDYALTLVSFLAGPKDPECVPVLIDGLAYPSFAVRIFVFEGLMRMGPSARPAVPALTTALGDPNLDIRVLAGVCLWKIDGQTNVAIPLLHSVVNTQMSSYTRRSAAGWLREIDPHDEEVIPVFITRLSSSSAEIRKEAIEVLGTYGNSAKDAVPTLVKLLNSDHELRNPILSALKQIAPETAAKFEQQ